MKQVVYISGFLTVVFFILAVTAYYGDWFELPDDVSDFSAETLPQGQAAASVQLHVTESGIVEVTEKTLRDTLLPFGVFSSGALGLTRNGEPVQFHIDDRDPDNQALYFYAKVITDSLQAPATYVLTAASSEPMPSEDGNPTQPGGSTAIRTQRWEENTQFLFQADAIDSWLGPLIWAPTSIEVALDNILPAENSVGTLTVRVWSNNQAQQDPDHHLQLALNGVPIADEYWDGITNHTVTVEIAAGILQPKNNILTLSAPGDTGAAGEAIYVDWIELEYLGDLTMSNSQPIEFTSSSENIFVRGISDKALVFNVFDESETTVITNFSVEENDGIAFSQTNLSGTFVVLEPGDGIHPEMTTIPIYPQSLKSAGRGADYIAIVPTVAPGFEDALQPLLDHRGAQGYQVTSVDLDQIYSEFDFGRKSPEAIKDFVNYAVDNWEPAPRFVLLVGDATYDPNNNLQGTNSDLLPTQLIFTEYAGYVATDTYFATMGDDLIPRVAIGRFPAQTSKQLATMVDKTINYEQSEPSSWQKQALLVADDEGQFNVVSDELKATLETGGYNSQTLYMTENENINNAIISAINKGVGIINYVGHGSMRVWGDERVFRVEDTNSLINDGRLPIFTTFTCLNGYFNHPNDDALAEALLYKENGGIVAAIAPSGRSTTIQQTPLANGFFEGFLASDVTTLGEALQQSKTYAPVTDISGESLNDVIHTFNLLGDPALQIQLP